MRMRFKTPNVLTLAISAFCAATLLASAAPAEAGFLSDLFREVFEDVKRETHGEVKQTTREVTDKVAEERREATDCALGRRDCREPESAPAPKPAPAATSTSQKPSTTGGLQDLL